MSKIFDLYTNPKHPGAYSGLTVFTKNNKKFKSNIVKQQLLQTKAYTQHIAPNRKFKRRVIIYGIDYLWQADLLDAQKIKHQNSHFRYILTVIDCFSKYVWAVPIKFLTRCMQQVFLKTRV